jgi:hypothetical protein
MIKFLLSVILIILSASLFSQDFEGGFFGGLTASQIDGDLFSGYNKAGITAGVYTTRKISSAINWKLEIRYIQKGSYQKYTETNPVMYKTSLHYVEFPLMLQYYYNRKVYLEAGLIPEILLSSKEEDESGIVPVDQSVAFHRFSMETAAGVGYFLTDKIAAGFRYSYSLLTAREHASGQTYLFNRGQYNNVLSFSVYYHFR